MRGYILASRAAPHRCIHTRPSLIDHQVSLVKIESKHMKFRVVRSSALLRFVLIVQMVNNKPQTATVYLRITLALP